jgi:hypothetical protein
VDLRRLTVTLLVACVLAAVPVLGLAACGTDTRPCRGQCGPPFQLHVAFRHGTSTQVGQAVLHKCAADNPEVESIGPVELRPLSAGAKPEPQAIVYTRSLGNGGAASRRLVACLNSSSAVLGAAYPD